MAHLVVALSTMTGAADADLLGRGWHLVGHPTVTASAAGLHVGGTLIRDGTVDAVSFTIDDVPASTEDGYLAFEVAGVGRWFFQVPVGVDPVSVGEEAETFVAPIPLGPRPGPEGPRGLPGVQGLSEIDVYAATDNVGGAPDPPVVAVGGTVSVATLTVTVAPAGWSVGIVAAAAEQTGWFCRTFVNPAVDVGVIVPVWSGPGELGGQGPPGRSVQGNPGDKGWSPLLSAPVSGDRVVHRISGWTGGDGARPAGGRYLGPLGLVDTAAAASNVRGPKGDPGTPEDLPSWVTDDDEDIPNNKIAANIARDSEIPSEADIESTADARIRGGVEPFARDTSTDIPVGKFDQVANAIDTLLGSDAWRTGGGGGGTAGRQTYATNTAVTTTSDLGTAINDVILRIGGDSLTVYRRSSDTSPYLTFVGTIQDVTAQVAAAVAAQVSAWAIVNNSSAIPAGKLSAVEQWARINTSTKVPLAKLPVLTRTYLPADLREVPVAGTTGQVVKKTATGYGWGTDETGSGGSGDQGSVPRWRYVRGEDTADPFANANKVFIGFRYIDVYRNSDNVLVRTVDLNAFAYMPAVEGAGYVLTPATAFDLAALYSSGSTTARFELVTALPNIGQAAFGVQYGLSTTDGQVLTVHFKREVVTTEQLFIPERLSATHRDLHGFSNLPDTSAMTYGYAPGGALSPEAEVREIVEEQDAAGNRTLRLVIAKTSPLNSAIAVTIFWNAPGETYHSNRSLALSHDATYSSAADNRYASPVYGASQPFRLTPGVAYTIKWRPAGTTHDLVLHSAAVWAQVADELDLLNLRGELLKEIYEVESLIPSSGGGVGDIETWTAPSPGLNRNIYHRTNITIDTTKTWLHIRFIVGAGGPQILQYARVAVAELLALPVSTQANNSNIVETSPSSGLFTQPTTDRYNIMSGHLQHYAIGGVQKLIVAHHEDGGSDWPFNNTSGISYAWGD